MSYTTHLAEVVQSCVNFVADMHATIASAFHKHKCGNCGHIWEHSNGCGGDVKAHTCEKCGEEQWIKWFGVEDAGYMFANLLQDLDRRVRNVNRKNVGTEGGSVRQEHRGVQGLGTKASEDYSTLREWDADGECFDDCCGW